jgi:serine/threonine protein kinase/formylglycine-generating enzyme required for sulfatase activity
MAQRGPEFSHQSRLDRLVARFLQAEEDGLNVDVEQFLGDTPDLRAPFQEFLRQHRELKPKREDSEVATLPLLQKKATSHVEQPVHRTLGQGQVVGDCSVLGELGRGGMGVVYQGRHVRLDALRAIKILPREKVSDEAVARFWREAQSAAKLDHLNVVTIHDVGQEDDLHYIIMQFVDGVTLVQALKRHFDQTQGTHYPWQMALRIVHPVLDALGVMHSRGLIHRDIKPSNIMLAEKSSLSRLRHVMLMDFGLVGNSSEGCLTQTGAVVGTPAYMAPEQARGEFVDGRADIYGVGACLYYLFTGRSPFEGHQAQVFYKAVRGERPQSIRELRPDLEPSIHALVERAMAPDIAQRYSRAEEMLKDINAILRQAPKESKQPRAASSKHPDPSPPGAKPPNPALSDTQHDTVSNGADASVGQSLLAPLEAVPAPGPSDALPAVFMIPKRGLMGFAEAGVPWAVWGPVAGTLVMIALAVSGLALMSSAPLATPHRPKAIAHDGMVHIPAGIAHVGANERRLRSHAQTLPSARNNQEWLEKFVSFCLQEPEQSVRLDGFWIDKYEVTNEEYGRFLKSANYPPPAHWTGGVMPPGKADHPVTNLRYRDAAAYATWAGKKLPTIHQWARAFRGEDDRMYPWGDTWQADRANTSQNRAFPLGTSPVTASPLDVSAFGVFNMVGNVSEIVRERTTYNGQSSAITKGADSECLGDLYGAAPFRVYLVGEEQTHHLTGFRCVIEND